MSAERPDEADGQAVEHLTFSSDGHRFAMRVSDIAEIRGYGAITPVPCSAPGILGIMNHRGALLPVADFALLISSRPTEQTDRKVVIVMENEHGLFGVLVDAVSDIVFTTPENCKQSTVFPSEGADHRSGAFIEMDGLPFQVVDPKSVEGMLRGLAGRPASA